MDRLISADKLRHDILHDNTFDSDTKAYLINMVDGMETEFEVDKVAAQLEENAICSGNKVSGFILLNKAIPIVKGGGRA